MLEKDRLENGYVRITFRVSHYVWADEIALVGEFNGWDAHSHPLSRTRDDKEWHISLVLEANRSYHFRYLVDGKEWMDDDHADGYEPNPFGGFDSRLRLKNSTAFASILRGANPSRAAINLYLNRTSGGVTTRGFLLLHNRIATAGYLLYKARHRADAAAPERLYYSNYRLHHWPAGMAVSSVAGMVSGLLGVGGGFFKVPVMYAIMGAPLGVATATSNSMVAITAAASVFVYYGRGDIHPLVVIPTALGMFGGAMLGAYILPRLRVAWLRLGLLGLLVLMGVQMLLQ